MEEIDFVTLRLETRFKPTYVNCTPHWGNRTEEYYLSEEEYLKLIDFIKELKK